MNWTQYWDMQSMSFTLGLILVGGLMIVGVVGFVAYMVYDKIQDWRGQ